MWRAQIELVSGYRDRVQRQGTETVYRDRDTDRVQEQRTGTGNRDMGRVQGQGTGTGTGYRDSPRRFSCKLSGNVVPPQVRLPYSSVRVTKTHKIAILVCTCY
jgi:hypothetical protein